MAKFSYEHGSTSVILRVKILDSSKTDGSGLTGLVFGSSGLIISTIADAEAAKTVYTAVASNIEDITTIGTYAAPTASKCRFKEVDATNHPGIYEIQLADARYAVTNARSLQVAIHGAANAAQTDAEIQLAPVPANVKEWLGAVPNALDAGRVSAREQPTEEGTAQAGASLSITLRSGASSTTDDPKLVFHMVRIVAGTGVGQRRLASSTYNGTTKELDIGTAWATTPDATSKYEILEANFADANMESWRQADVQPQTKSASGLVKYPPVIAADIADGGSDGITGLQAIGLAADNTNGRIAGIVGTKTNFDALNDLSAAAMNAEVDNALNTGIPGSPTTDSINERLKTLDDAYTAARAVFLDNLNVGGLVAAQADVQAITQAQRVRIAVSAQLERPDSGSITYRVWIYVYDETHIAEDLDSNPTVTAENNAGTDRSSNVSAVTKPASTTGRYYFDYTVADTHAIEAIVFKVDATEGAVTTQYPSATFIVDYTSWAFTAADRTDLVAIKAKTDNLTATPADQAKLDELHDNRITAARAANLDNLDVNVSTRATPAQVNTEAANALVAIHLDHLLAVDTPTLPGVNGSILHDLLEDDGGTWRFIANALEQAPGGGGSDPEVLKSGTVAASPAPTATTLSATALSEATTDFWVNKVVHITSGSADGLTARITAFDPAQDQITFAPALVVAPVAGVTFDILRKHVEAPGSGATDFDQTQKNLILLASRKLVNKRDHNVASGKNRFYDDAGTGVIQTDTPSETGGVVTVTPS